MNSYHAAYRVKSSTMNLNELFDSEGGNFEDYIKDFKPDEKANGLAVFSDDRLVNIDVFNRTDIYREYFPKILRSSAIEIFQLDDSARNLAEADAISRTESLFGELAKAPFSEHPGVGEGNEKRYDNDEFTGFELSFGDKMVHLTLLSIEKGRDF